MSSDKTLTDFLNYFNAQNTNHLMTLFCKDDPGPPVIPCVGITTSTVGLIPPQAGFGPTFIGTAEIKNLFDTLFTTFPDVTLTQIPGTSELYSKDLTTNIAIQTKLQGTHKDKWFRDKKHYSKPLSDIYPASNQMTLPACPVFTFNGTFAITQLAIYFDRYFMHYLLTTPP